MIDTCQKYFISRTISVLCSIYSDPGMTTRSAQISADRVDIISLY